MATRIMRGRVSRGDDRFFFVMAVVMALTLVAGFSVQLAMGRSSFQAPMLVHVHALTFFGWTVYFVVQAGLGAGGSLGLHRRLGWLGAAWAAAMVIVGTAATVAMVRRGAVPFFFQPLGFLLMNALSVLTFALLVAAAIALRRRTDWHRRLLYCGMALLTGPGWGRLLPMPLLIPFAELAVFGAVMIFPLIGVIADLRRSGRVHPAWWAGIAALCAFQLSLSPLAHSVAGQALYASVTAGTPGAAVPPLAYPPLPPF
jgi:hypothetical protein